MTAYDQLNDENQVFLENFKDYLESAKNQDSRQRISLLFHLELEMYCDREEEEIENIKKSHDRMSIEDMMVYHDNDYIFNKGIDANEFFITKAKESIKERKLLIAAIRKEKTRRTRLFSEFPFITDAQEIIDEGVPADTAVDSYLQPFISKMIGDGKLKELSDLLFYTDFKKIDSEIIISLAKETFPIKDKLKHRASFIQRTRNIFRERLKLTRSPECIEEYA